MDDPLAALQARLQHRFSDPRLLARALTHRSFSAEHNERLEFLGDSVLAAVVAHQLYVENPGLPEGDLSKKKSSLVSRPSLALWAEQLGLGSHLLLGVGEESTGGRTRQSLLANAVEAVIGAMYLDGGYEAAARFIRSWCSGKHVDLQDVDHKSRLQEVLQKRHGSPPVYELTASLGPDHDKTFSVAVRMGEAELGRGTGKTKKDAEQAAARDALARMKGV